MNNRKENPLTEWGSIKNMTIYRELGYDEPSDFCRYVVGDVPKYNMKNLKQDICDMAMEMWGQGYAFIIENKPNESKDELKIVYKLGVTELEYVTRRINYIDRVEEKYYIIGTGKGEIHLTDEGVKGYWNTSG